jgi:hypothetical protein
MPVDGTSLLARILDESPAATKDMVVLPASSGVGSCDVQFRYASEPIPRYRGTVARWHAHLHALAMAIHQIYELAKLSFSSVFFMW